MHAWRAHHRPHRRSPRATLAAALTYVGQSLMALLNIAAWLRPDVLIGGFHLREGADPALVEQVGRRLLALGGIYYTCHCTSEGAYARLKDIMVQHSGTHVVYIHQGRWQKLGNEFGLDGSDETLKALKDLLGEGAVKKR